MRLLIGSAIFTALYSALTRFELGMFKVLPMKAHLGLDAAQTLAMASAPFVFVNSRKSVTAALLGISVFEVLVTLNSQSRPCRKFLWLKI